MAIVKGRKFPWSRIGRLISWIFVAYAALIAFYLAVFRLQARPLNEAMRTFNKHVLNPTMMALDRRHLYAATLHHEGRRTGKEYSTPVTAEPIKGDFIIPLSYGENVDWLRNVRSAGRCTIESRDGTYTVGDPEVVDRATALAAVEPRARLMFKVFGLDSYLKLKRLSRTSGEESNISETIPSKEVW